MEDGDPRRFLQLAGGVEPGAAEGDVVRLPLAGRARGVEQGRILAVDRAGLAVGVGVGLVRVQHLDLELAHQEDAAVAAILALTLGRARRGPLDVELDVAPFEAAVRAFRTQCDQAVAKDAAVQAYVRQLEQAYDATGDETPHPRRDEDFNPEQLMHELEDFLRQEREGRGD